MLTPKHSRIYLPLKDKNMDEGNITSLMYSVNPKNSIFDWVGLELLQIAYQAKW